MLTLQLIKETSEISYPGYKICDPESAKTLDKAFIHILVKTSYLAQNSVQNLQMFIFDQSHTSKRTAFSLRF